MSQFLGWIATLPAYLQIILVVAAFLAVIALLLFFIEIAPRTGRIYTAIRLAVCVLVPLVAMLLLGSVLWAALIAAVLGGLFFLIDYRSKQGAGYLLQLVGFMAPAAILLSIGLLYPTIGTTIQAFQDNRSRNFVGFDNFVWIFTQPFGIRVVLTTIVWVLVVPALSTAFGLAYAAFIDKSRGEKIFKALGYTRRDSYHFAQKKLDAYWYSPPSEKLPRIFVSELRVADLSESVER